MSVCIYAYMYRMYECVCVYRVYSVHRYHKRASEVLELQKADGAPWVLEAKPCSSARTASA